MDIPSVFAVQVGGRTLEFPVVPLANAPLSIALFDSQGDLALCDFLAERLIATARDQGHDPDSLDVILTAGKAITLAEATARKLGIVRLSIAEKQAKNFWPTSFGVPSRSITGGKQEQLVVGGRRAEMLRGKRILVIDDVISTGESIHALIGIARHFGEASLVMAPFAEGGTGALQPVDGVPTVVLASLPVWHH